MDTHTQHGAHSLLGCKRWRGSQACPGSSRSPVAGPRPSAGTAPAASCPAPGVVAACRPQGWERARRPLPPPPPAAAEGLTSAAAPAAPPAAAPAKWPALPSCQKGCCWIQRAAWLLGAAATCLHWPAYAAGEHVGAGGGRRRRRGGRCLGRLGGAAHLHRPQTCQPSLQARSRAWSAPLEASNLWPLLSRQRAPDGLARMTCGRIGKRKERRGTPPASSRQKL